MSIKTRLLSSDIPTATHDGTAKENLDSTATDLLRFNRYDCQRYPFLMASSATRKNNTQYDILLAFPQYSVTLNADKSLSCSDESIALSPTFFDTLEDLFQHNKSQVIDNDTDLPYTGGWFVYLSYEMAGEVEPGLSLPLLPEGQPLAVAVRCPAALIYDKQKQQCFALAEAGYEHLLDAIENDYQVLFQRPAVEVQPVAKIELDSIIEADASAYLAQVKKIKHYIVEGDIFQANLSRGWQAVMKHDVADADIFKLLSQRNPSAFAALACLKKMTIISSSPERLVSVRKGIVETRPIAGTRPRNLDQQADEDLADELMKHPKEQAEHIMLIDLERNDLGRVCRPGSIEVNELMTLESWEHVHHIVSNVRGELRQDKSPIDVLRAVFPGGTITGCPKVRCMEILAELEQQPRGAYTGSLGYITNDGSMDFNILIRTIIRCDNQLTFRAGGGIVNDSIAENELEETRAKAKGLLKIFQ